MTVTPKRLYLGNPPNVDTDLYTAPAGGAVVLVIHADNTTAGALTISLRIDPTAGATTDLLTARSVPANDYVHIGGPIHLEAGDKLVGRNHGGTGVALTVSGIEIS